MLSSCSDRWGFVWANEGNNILFKDCPFFSGSRTSKTASVTDSLQGNISIHVGKKTSLSPDPYQDSVLGIYRQHHSNHLLGLWVRFPLAAELDQLRGGDLLRFPLLFLNFLNIFPTAVYKSSVHSRV